MTGVVSSGSIVTMCITLFISLVLPILLLVIYAGKHRGEGVVKAWLLGAAGFYVTQLVIRTTILSVLSMTEGFMAFVEKNYLLYAVLLGLTAGLFEVVGRFACAKLLSKNELTFTKAISAGLGHGGIEAMVLLGITYINNLLYAVMINNGTVETVLEEAKMAGADISQIHAFIDTLINTPAPMYLLAGYERILTMIAQVAMTLVVFYFMWKKQTAKGIGICVIYHTLVDAGAGIISGLATPYMGSVISQNTSYVIIYIYLTIMTAGAIAFIYKVRNEWKEGL